MNADWVKYFETRLSIVDNIFHLMKVFPKRGNMSALQCAFLQLMIM